MSVKYIFTNVTGIIFILKINPYFPRLPLTQPMTGTVVVTQIGSTDGKIGSGIFSDQINK